MIEEENKNHTSNFSLFTNEELQQQSFIHEINFLTEKYNILENENKLISSTEKSFLYIINYAFNLHNKKQQLPSDIESLFLNNIFLKEQVNDFLEKKLTNLTNDDNIHFINDINLILFLTTIGSNKSILNQFHDYNLESLCEVFRYYETNLKSLFSTNKVLFLVTFDLYIVLLKTLIQLCTISSINLIKKADIFEIIEFITETINIIKFNIELEDYELCKINNLQGRSLYHFAHLENIPIKPYDLDSFFKLCLLCLEKQEDGFRLSSNNNFGYEKNVNKDLEFFKFRNYASILLLEMLKKLKELEIDSYYENEYFQKIMKTYYKNFSIDSNIKMANSSKDFENTLIKSFLYNYNFTTTSTKILDYQFIIDDFILSNKSFDNKNLETIYRILFFVSKIKPYTFIHISQILVESDVIKNDYHEFFKLSIFNLFITKFIDEKIDTNLDELFLKISTYVLQNSFDFHLLSICSKIYLNLSLLYSKNIETVDKSKDFYTIFLFLSGMHSSSKTYEKKKNIIIKNLQILNIDENEIINQFLLKKEKEIVYLLNLIEKKSFQENIESEKTKESLLNFIEYKLFYGLCRVCICQNEQLEILGTGFEKEILDINPEFKIEFLFSKSNEKTFRTLFDYHKDFIKNEISKILNIFNQKKAKFYIDDDEIELIF